MENAGSYVSQWPPQTVSSPTIGWVNRAALLRELAADSLSTVRELSGITGLSVPAVSRTMTDLVTTGMVLSEGPMSGRLGRRPVGYRLNPDHCRLVSVDLGQRPGVVAVGNLGGEILGRTTVEAAPDGGVAANLVPAIRRLVDAQGDTPLGAVVVANPGVVCPEAGSMTFPAATATWADEPLRELLAAQLGVPVVVVNDVKLATIGEMWTGAGNGVRDFLYLRLEVGLSIGIVNDGRLVSGAHNAAGEVGAMPLAAGASNGEVPTMEEFLTRERGDDAVNRDRLHVLGDLVGMVSSMLDPEVVLLGGRLAGSVDDADIEALRDRAGTQCLVVPKIKRASHGVDAALIGGFSIGHEIRINSVAGRS